MDIGQVLRRDFEMRRTSNPRLSIRAYARYLDYDASTLAKILAGRRMPGIKTSRQLAERVGWSPDGESSESQKQAAEFFNLSGDHFKVIADWYHFAILEVMNLDHFRPEATWIARKLGISVHDVRAAIGRLQRIGLLSIDPQSKRWTLNEGRAHSTTGIQGTSSALKQMQRQILNKALQALDNVPVARRSQSSMTMAVDSSRLVEANEKIKSFRRSLSLFLESGTKKDEVYILSMSLFPAQS